jgi:hypothetical protein
VRLDVRAQARAETTEALAHLVGVSLEAVVVEDE